jgi:hypothetical protein
MVERRVRARFDEQVPRRIVGRATSDDLNRHYRAPWSKAALLQWRASAP